MADKGFAGDDFEEFLASPPLALTLIRPARKDEKKPRHFPNWLRQRVEAIIWTLKNQLGLEHHDGRVPAGLWARVLQRLHRAQRRHLAQLADRRTGQTLANRLRPLNCPDIPVNDLGQSGPETLLQIGAINL